MEINSPLQQLHYAEATKRGIEIYIKRDDLIDPDISGNKWRKLKYNLIKAESDGHDQILTFGGAFSNHIAATAAAGKKFGIKTVGVIRGEEVTPLNDTLAFARECRMKLKFISRTAFKDKNDPYFVEELRKEFGTFFLVPEGGANFYGINGCIEVLNEIDLDFDYICTAVGTGTTLAGLALSLKNEQQAIGFPILKPAEEFYKEVDKLLYQFNYNKKSEAKYQLATDYHFRGYAKTTDELIDFIRSFHKDFNIKLDPIYTGKMVFGVFDLIKKDFFPSDSKIVLLHTGGIQGVAGIEKRDKIRIF